VGFRLVRPESRLQLRDLSAAIDKSIEPIDRIYFASYNPVVQIGAVITSIGVITWAYHRKTGSSRTFWLIIGAIPVLLLVIRNLTAQRQRENLSDRIGQYVSMSERINDIFYDIPDMEPPGGDYQHSLMHEADFK
jgi:ABC-type transport system involved in cytochrome bd biosynthesis fused ATPase/permease subunit